jgi:Mg-chelatase subunit ChlD
MKRTILGIVSPLLFVAGYLAAQPSCRTSVPVIAFDQKTGDTIDSSTANDFRAEMNGSKVRVSALTGPPPTRRIVFVLDRSGSMFPDKLGGAGSDYNRRLLANTALNDALSSVPAVDSVAFLGFAGNCPARTPFLPTDIAKTKSADILGWTPERKCGNRTPLWDNIEIALRMLNTHMPGDAIIVISDGGDNTSKISETQLQKELLLAGVPVFAIVLANPYSPTSEERAGPGNLQDLAEATGGTFAGIEEPAQSSQQVRQLTQSAELVSLLAHQYNLTLELPDFNKPRAWKLTVPTADAGKRISLLYPKYLYPCAPVQ